MKKIRLDTRGIVGVLGLALSVYWYAEASGFATSKLDIAPGAGFFPKGLAVILAVICVIMIVRSLISPEACMKFKSMEKIYVVRLLLVIPAIIVFILLWKYTHFIPAFFLLMLGLSLLLGVKWYKGAIFSCIFTLLTYYLFTGVLQVMLRI